jgi:hypothetical protein
LSNLFGGQQKEILFQDLWIGKSGVWDFAKEEHPVIHLDMSLVAGSDSNVLYFKQSVADMLEDIANSFDVEIKIDEGNIKRTLKSLISELKRKYKKPVVIIIDEYDKPVLDLIDEPKKMEAVRKSLQSFYSVLKGEEANLRLVFITGLYKFTQMSMFSTLNNLEDISLSIPAGTLVGYTENEIKENFRDRMKALKDELNIVSDDVLMNELKEHYNGYRFGLSTASGRISESIYNPYAINYIFKDLQLTDKWITSGSASMLAKKLSNSGERYEDHLTTSMSELVEACTPDEMTITSLMYYGGYSTIDKVTKNIILKIPNNSIYKYLAKDYLKAKFSVSDVQPFVKLAESIYDIMTQSPINEMISKTVEMSELIDNLLNQYTYLTITSEGEFRNIVDSVLKINFNENQIHHEILTKNGRIDTIITLSSRIFIIEYKYIKDPSEAIKQIHDKDYYGRYLARKVPVILLGISCNKDDKRKVYISCEIKNNEKQY